MSGRAVVKPGYVDDSFYNSDCSSKLPDIRHAVCQAHQPVTLSFRIPSHLDTRSLSDMTPSPIFTSLVLPNGTSVPNRIAKAAMEENIADIQGSTPSKQLIKLYDAWAKGGTGTIITGHVMVDRSAMSGPGEVALDEHSDLAPFREWAEVAKAGGAQVWMQINHPGRQMPADLGLQGYAPSAVSSLSAATDDI